MVGILLSQEGEERDEYVVHRACDWEQHDIIAKASLLPSSLMSRGEMEL